jgi:hypothetical protein
MLAPYFRPHLFEVADHMPPAFSQSARLVIFDRSVAVPDGLAEGELDEPPDVPGVDAPGDVVVPLPVPMEPEPLVPDGLLEPELPPVVPEGLLEPEPLGELPLPVCAAANAGASAMIPTKNTSISFSMCFLPLSDLPPGSSPAAILLVGAISGPSI